MLTSSTRSLKISAALVWYIGSIFLVLKGSTLLYEAYRIDSQQIWIWLAIILGILIGVIKAKYIFNLVCKKNLVRIDLLKKPNVWQFYQPRFYIFLVMMIVLGGTLSRIAHYNYPFLIGVATLDFSLAVALLASSHTFWKQKAFEK
jgi:hypothetical protein